MNRIILFFQGETRSCITKINNLIWRVVCGINTTSLPHLKGGCIIWEREVDVLWHMMPKWNDFKILDFCVDCNLGGKLLHGIFQFLLPAKMDKSSTLEYINQMFPTGLLGVCVRAKFCSSCYVMHMYYKPEKRMYAGNRM